MSGSGTPGVRRIDPVLGGGPRVPGLLSAYAKRPDPAWEAALAAFGSLWAAVVAYLLLQYMPLRSFSWAALFFKAAAYIGFAVGSGVFGIWLTCAVCSRPSSSGLGRLARTAGVGWVFLPAVALFYSQKSPWVFPALAVASAVMAVSLRGLFPALAEPEPEDGGRRGPLPSVYGLPPMDSQPMRAVFLAVCVQGALLLAVGGSTFLAMLLFAPAVYLLVWRWSAFGGSVAGLAGGRQAAYVGAAAMLLTMFALLPYIAGGGSAGGTKSAGKQPAAASDAGETRSPDSDYIGIVLWPPPKKKTEIVAPRPQAEAFALGRKAEPVVIPFDGPYWYFRPPSQEPGPHAHVAHGKATEVNVHSTGWLPLRMEAHQNLGLPISLACCGEIDVALTNADTRPGLILVGVVLTDSSMPGAPTLNLGLRPLLSSEDALIPSNRPPVPETLRFMVPKTEGGQSIAKFDRITVVFEPSRERMHYGAKVSVESFKLMPR